MLKSEAFPSRFLSVADLNGKEFTLLISHCEIEQAGDEDKPVLHFSNAKKPLVLNTINWDSIAAIVGSEDSDTWAGHKITVYVDPTVRYGNKITGGIRVKPPASRPAPPPRPAPQSLQEAGDMMDDEIPF